MHVAALYTYVSRRAQKKCNRRPAELCRAQSSRLRMTIAQRAIVAGGNKDFCARVRDTNESIHIYVCIIIYMHQLSVETMTSSAMGNLLIISVSLLSSDSRKIEMSGGDILSGFS